MRSSTPIPDSYDVWVLGFDTDPGLVAEQLQEAFSIDAIHAANIEHNVPCRVRDALPYDSAEHMCDFLASLDIRAECRPTPVGERSATGHGSAMMSSAPPPLPWPPKSIPPLGTPRAAASPSLRPSHGRIPISERRRDARQRSGRPSARPDSLWPSSPPKGAAGGRYDSYHNEISRGRKSSARNDALRSLVFAIVLLGTGWELNASVLQGRAGILGVLRDGFGFYFALRTFLALRRWSRVARGGS